MQKYFLESASGKKITILANCIKNDKNENGHRFITFYSNGKIVAEYMNWNGYTVDTGAIYPDE